MFKKAAIILLIAISAAACTKASDLEKVYNPKKGFETGLWQAAIIAEATTNFSSLLYDKTEAQVDSFTVHPMALLPDNAGFYIMPVIYTDTYNKKTYDDGYSRMIGSYLVMNGFGRAVSSMEEADYVMVVNVSESPEKFYGTNTSTVMLSIMEPDETPVFYAKTAIHSNSDKNFYYRPSKGAKSVKYLTLKGFEKIFEEALPQAFS